MLHTILRVTLPGNAKAIPNWHRVNLGVCNRIELTKDRFKKAPVFYSGMHQIFRYLLLNLDFEFLNQVALNPMAYYLSDLVPRADVVKKVFDTVSISTENYGMLMDRQNQPNIPEIWISTSRKNPLRNLPLDSIDWNNWSKVRSAIVFSYDTPYLNVDFLKGTLTFPPETTPTYGMVGVDIPCLWLKFISWWKAIGIQKYGRQTPQPSDYDDFIHLIVMPKFYQDFSRIFTLNILNLLMQAEMVKFKDSIGALKNDYRIAMSGFDAGCVDLYTCLQQVQTRDMTVEDFLSTPWFVKDTTGASFTPRNLMHDYQTNWTIPDLRQYYWVTLIRDLELSLFTVALLKRSPSYPIGQRTKKELLYKIDTYERAIPWSYVHTPALRAKLESSFVRIREAIML